MGRFAIGVGVLLAAACASAVAQEWPSRPVRIIAPFAPGGSADSLGRLVARELGEQLKQSFLVENRPGAGGAIGSELVAKSPPDGYTLVVSGIASHVIAPVMAKLPYDPLASFTHIALLGGPPNALVVNASVPARDVESFLAFARGRPGGLSYGSPGGGTHGHLMGELFQDLTRAPLVHIPYKGAAPAMTDLLAGQIQGTFTTLSSALPNIRAGKLRAIAVTSAVRMSELPDVPTFAEAGYPQLQGVTWFAISGPAGMPAAIVERLNTEIRRALTAPKVRERLQMDGAEPNELTATGFTAFVRQELARWGPIARNVRLTD